MNTIKNTLLSIVGIAGAGFSALFGGFDMAMITMLVFMAVDYITGLVVAGVFKKSQKTKNGCLESRVGLKGILKKGGMLLTVLVGVRLDLYIGSNIVRDGVILAFIVNETLSIIENLGLMGVPIPDVITKAIEVLKSKEGDNNDE